MRERVFSGVERPGGIRGYPLKSLYQEVAFVAYHFHWTPEAILNLEHDQRRRWVEEISSINERMSQTEESPFQQ